MTLCVRDDPLGDPQVANDVLLDEVVVFFLMIWAKGLAYTYLVK